ncbi:MAG: hypothetical protein EBV59_08240 [Synechococcaceae bacterium WB7_1C_051]|nr:hypothetical protein [Synechococcaceae bacterium WB7_1C_051]
MYEFPEPICPVPLALLYQIIGAFELAVRVVVDPQLTEALFTAGLVAAFTVTVTGTSWEAQAPVPAWM